MAKDVHTAEKRIHPTLFATIVMAPIALLQVVLPLTGVWHAPSDLIGVIVIDIIFWLVNFFIWSYAGRVRD